MSIMRNFTDDDKKQFNNTIEHVEDVQSRNPNSSAKFVDIDEKLVMAEGEEKVSAFVMAACAHTLRSPSTLSLSV